jgi:hypothetical protein
MARYVTCSAAFELGRASLPIPYVSLRGLLLASVVVSGCVQGQPASDRSDPGFPFGPTATVTGPVAFVQDIKPIFDRDCLECHSSRNARGNYSVS